MPPSESVHESNKPFCWLGGDTANVKPEFWHGPWWMQIAHIASGRGRAVRVNDRRAVVLLSPLAHLVHVSDRGRLPFMSVGRQEIPTIDERHTLYIKRKFDPEYYDRDFLQSIWIGRLPEPEAPPEWWQERFVKNQGITL